MAVCHRALLAVYLIVFLGILNEDVRFEIVLSARLEGALQIFAGFDASLYFGERNMFRKDDLVMSVKRRECKQRDGRRDFLPLFVCRCLSPSRRIPLSKRADREVQVDCKSRCIP